MLGILAIVATMETASANPIEESSRDIPKDAVRMNGAQIECTTPDGRIVEVASANDQNKSAAALIMEDDTLSCPLQEGQTTFVIKLTSSALLERFKFLNQNAAAAGKLKISVSNDDLPATSSKWVDVDGSISFNRKRLFNLSMVGVEARYVKLSFEVEKAAAVSSAGLPDAQTLDRFAGLK